MKKQIQVFALGVVVASGFGTARADILASWNLPANNTNGGTGDANAVAATTTLSGVDSASLLRGTGSGDAGGFSDAGYFANSWNATRANQKYIAIRVTPDAGGDPLDIDQIQFTQRTRDVGGPATWELYSSLDSFTASIATGTISTTNNPETILLGSAFDSISLTVEFRWYAFGGSGAPAGFDGAGTDPDVVVEGTVVPEPGSLALVGLGVLTVMRRRRG